MNFKELTSDLFGQTLEGVYFSECGSYMKIKTDKTEVYFDTEGGYLSSRIYYHEIFGVPEGNILELDMAGNIPDIPLESERQYGIDIRTTKGVVTVVYRNLSKGYYGGSSSRIDRVPNVKWLKQTGKD